MPERDLINASSESTLYLTPDEIRQVLDEGVARAVSYAYHNSPFYRARLEADGVRPEDVRTVDDLARVTPTVKRDLAGGEERFWCVPRERVVDIVTTSGTTGSPVVYPMTEGDLRRLAHNECVSFATAGLTSRDVVLLAVTMDKCFMAGLAYFEGLRKLGAAVVRVGSGSPHMLLNMIERLQPTAVVSVPSFLRRVAWYAREKGMDLAASSVTRAVCIGEPVRTEDFQLNTLGRLVAEAWGARVYSTYAATEIATSFCECEAGAGGHSIPELIHVEVLDDDGRAVSEGQVGEVTVTTLGVEAMPLVRFRTGDRAFLTSKRCACGRWTPRLGPIAGRRNQMMKIKGTTVYPAAVQNVLDSIGEVMDYVMIATSSTALSDELEVVVSARGGGAGLEEEVGERLQGALKVTPRVRVAAAGEVARLQDVEGYRKKRVFIDRRAANP